jgi:plasmid stabilization system protein ParE
VPRRLRYSDDAIADLVAIRDWLTQPGSGLAARRRLTAIRSAIRRLKQSSCLWPAGEHLGTRELPCDAGYRAMYEVNPDTGSNATAGDILVLRVFGPGQDRRRL